MKRFTKKAFTLVELLVVIAILAVLATVSVVGYNSFTKKATISNDNGFIAQLNAYVAAYTADGTDIKTVNEIDEELEQFDFSNKQFNPTTKGYHYGFDISKDKFVLIDDTNKLVDSDSNKIDVFALVNGDSDAKSMMDEGYSLYLQSTNYTSTLLDHINTGVDVGNNTDIASITYSNSESKQDVVIRTNGAFTTLTVDAFVDSTDNTKGDVINHYGNLGNLNVTKVAYGCYYEYGDTVYAKATAGKVVAKENGVIEILYASANTVSAKEDGGVINAAYCISTDASEATAAGFTNSSNTKGGNVTFKYKDENNNSITEAIIESKATTALNVMKVIEAVDKEITEEVANKACLNASSNIYYDTFDEAFDTVQNGETLVLIKDEYSFNTNDFGAITNKLENKNITINLNGKKLYSNGPRFEISSNSVLTINGNGIIECAGLKTNTCAIYVRTNSTFNFESGKLYVHNDNHKNYGIYGADCSTINIGKKDSLIGPTLECDGAPLATSGNCDGCTYNVYSGELIGHRADGDGDSCLIQLANQSTNGAITVNVYGGTFKQETNPTDGLNTIFEIRHDGQKTVNVYGGNFYCGEYMFRFNGAAHKNNDKIVLNIDNGISYNIWYKCDNCRNDTH